MVERRTGTPLTHVRFPGGARDFLPVNFQCRLSYGVRTPPCAIACINICGHVKDPVVHVRVRCIMETLKHPACTVGWVAQLRCSWLFLGKATRISLGRNPKWDNTIEKTSEFKLESGRSFRFPFQSPLFRDGGVVVTTVKMPSRFPRRQVIPKTPRSTHARPVISALPCNPSADLR